MYSKEIFENYFGIINFIVVPEMFQLKITYHKNFPLNDFR